MLYSHNGSCLNNNDSVALVAEMIRPGSRVLDVGCGAGDLGCLLQKKNCRVWGIEYEAENAAASEQTGAYEKIYRWDMNHFQAEMLADNFDYIVCADVLEHLMKPEYAVSQLKKLLAPEAKLIISVPNVAHASIKANLLLNDWTYTELGILDKTHLRFFTAKSFVDFLSSLGLVIEAWKMTTLPADGFQPHRLKELPDEVSAFISDDAYSEVMQFIVQTRLVKVGEKNALKNNEKFLKQEKRRFSGSRLMFEVKRLLLVKFPGLIKYVQRWR